MNLRDYVELLKSMGSPNQSKYFDAFEDCAEYFDNVDWDASKRLAGEFGFKTKECYYNAQKLAITIPNARYFEGWATSIIPIEHAWVVIDGRVVDPTWSGVTRLPDEVAYYGVEFSDQDIYKSWFENESAIPLITEFFSRYAKVPSSHA